MRKLVLMSVLIATLVVPVLLSKDTKPKRGAKRTVIIMGVFVMVWAYVIRYHYWSLG